LRLIGLFVPVVVVVAAAAAACNEIFFFGNVVETNVFALSMLCPCCFSRNCFQLIVG